MLVSLKEVCLEALQCEGSKIKQNHLYLLRYQLGISLGHNSPSLPIVGNHRECHICTSRRCQLALGGAQGFEREVWWCLCSNQVHKGVASWSSYMFLRKLFEEYLGCLHSVWFMCSSILGMDSVVCCQNGAVRQNYPFQIRIHLCLGFGSYSETQIGESARSSRAEAEARSPENA